METFFNSLVMGALSAKLAEATTTNMLVVIGVGGIILGVLFSMMFPKMWKAVK